MSCITLTVELPPPRATKQLTPHQIACLKGLAVGLSRKDIALQLKVSPKTVEYHCAQLMQRLNIYDTARLTHYALAHKLINPLY